MDDFKICIPTRERSGKVLTIDRLGLDPRLFTLFVADWDDYVSYRDYYGPDDVQVVHANVKPGIQFIRNAILKHYPAGTKIVMMDDDITSVCKLNKSRPGLDVMKHEEIIDLITKGFNLCENNGTNLWGLYPSPNHFFMSDKIQPAGFCANAFMGIVTSDIRYDPNLYLKEDYDFIIKHILKYKKIIRFCGYTAKAKYASNKGGCQSYRTAEIEDRAVSYLLGKYPWCVFPHPRRSHEVVLKFKMEK